MTKVASKAELVRQWWESVQMRLENDQLLDAHEVASGDR